MNFIDVFKPTKGKIILTLTFMVLAIFCTYVLPLTTSFTHLDYTKFNYIVNYIFWSPILLVLRLASRLQLNLVQGFLLLLSISLLYWYLLSCIIILIVNVVKGTKRKKKTHRKRRV